MIPGGLGGLLIRRPPKEDNENSENNANEKPAAPKTMYTGTLHAGETLQPMPFVEPTHQSHIFFVMKGDTIQRVRKVVPKEKYQENVYENAKKEVSIYNAIKKLEGWKQYVLPYEDGEINHEKETVIMDFDYVKGSDLLNFINTNRPSKETLRGLLTQAKNALLFCLRNSIRHGDVKAENFYVTHDGKHCYIFDFGGGTRKPLPRDIGRDVYDFRRMVSDILDVEIDEAGEMFGMTEKAAEEIYSAGEGGGRHPRRRGRPTRRARKVRRGTKRGRRRGV
jgi:serine/threonine protein kinase